MTRYKLWISVCLIWMMTMGLMAQTSTNSPYTRYGFGQLSDQNFGNSQAMGGISYGLRNGLQVNAANPASYSAVDSLTFIFDAGMSLQNANFKEGNVKTNAKNSSVDYIAMQFRLMKGLGFTAGFLPYSTVGYSMNRNNPVVTDEFGNTTSATQQFYGTGGLQQVFFGLGYNVFKGLSVGANFSYLYGDITHTSTTTFSNANAFSSARTNKIEVSDYKLDFGVQYSHQLKEKHVLNLGATYSYGHNLNSTGYEYVEKYQSSTVATQSIDTIKNAFALPHTFGIGATYVYDNRLTIGADYTLQKWADAKFFNEKNAFQNRSKISIGAEYLPNHYGRGYLQRIRYRAGVYYSSPYAKIDGKDGNREYGISFGIGLPLTLYQYRSILNISGQYVKVSPKVKGMLEENYLRINIGLTFNERWFMKWKVD
ncbi:MAG: hypothetical protein IJZ40_03740 [Bacteroidaceae bacterium]|nr:hypothetical protein [Bacteroidaceae bacterium]